MHHMDELELWRQRRDELIRAVEEGRLAWFGAPVPRRWNATPRGASTGTG